MWTLDGSGRADAPGWRWHGTADDGFVRGQRWSLRRCVKWFVGLAFARRFGIERLKIIDAGPSIAGTPAPSARRCVVGCGAGIALVIPPHSVIVIGRDRRPRVAVGELVFYILADAVRLGATRSLWDFAAIRFKFFR